MAITNVYWAFCTPYYSKCSERQFPKLSCIFCMSWGKRSCFFIPEFLFRNLSIVDILRRSKENFLLEQKGNALLSNVIKYLFGQMSGMFPVHYKIFGFPELGGAGAVVLSCNANCCLWRCPLDPFSLSQRIHTNAGTLVTAAAMSNTVLRLRHESLMSSPSIQEIMKRVKSQTLHSSW